jgi:hypothetical protein
MFGCRGDEEKDLGGGEGHRPSAIWGGAASPQEPCSEERSSGQELKTDVACGSFPFPLLSSSFVTTWDR